MNKAAFMGPEWLARATAILQAVVDARPDAGQLRLTLIERFHNLPADAPTPQQGEPCLWVAIQDGRVDIRYGAPAGQKAMAEIDCDWTDAWQAASLREGPELDRLRAQQMARGRLRLQGDLAAWAPLLTQVHEAMADLTAPPPV